MRKSFKGENPALQFITAQQDTAQDTQPTEPAHLAQDTQPAQPTEPAQVTEPAHDKGAEIKSARMNLVLRPSLAEALKQIATMRRTSVNNLVNETLEALAETEAGTIAKYNATFERTNENA